MTTLETITAEPTDLERLQDANDRLQAEVDSLRAQLRKLEESSETILGVADSKYELEEAVADKSLRSLCYLLEDIGGWEIQEGKYTVDLKDGPSLECEAEIVLEADEESTGVSAGVEFSARLVGLVFEVSN